jgi:hypothetical protein
VIGEEKASSIEILKIEQIAESKEKEAQII